MPASLRTMSPSTSPPPDCACPTLPSASCRDSSMPASPSPRFALEVTETVLFGNGSTNVERSLAALAQRRRPDRARRFRHRPRFADAPSPGAGRYHQDRPVLRPLASSPTADRRRSSPPCSNSAAASARLSSRRASRRKSTRSCSAPPAASRSQGYHYARPMPAADLHRYLAAQASLRDSSQGSRMTGVLS